MIEDYARALKLGQKTRRSDIAAGRYPYVPALDDIVADANRGAEQPLGVMEIPVSLVAGTKTKGRQSTFASDFMPLLASDTEFASKWSSLYDAQRAEGIRDPIVAYEYLQRFYVMEGNKRLSVMRYLHNPSIMASVIRVMPRGGDPRELQAYTEFTRFFRVAPVWGLSFSDASSYGALARQYGRDLETAWPEETVRLLRSSMSAFRAALARRKDILPSAVASDAFLVYLRIFGASSLVDDTAHGIDEKIEAVWGDLAVPSKEKAVAFLGEPGAGRSRGAVVPGIVSSLRSVVETHPFRVAFIHEGDPDTSSWTWSHEEGRLDLERRCAGKVETTSFMDCLDAGAFDRAVAAAVADESDLVVTTSAALGEQSLRAAVEHPGTIFINCSLYHAASAMRAFYGRMYEAKFIAGALAASMAENHMVGYLAGSPTYGSVAEINAFARGAQVADAQAKVHLKWYSVDGDTWRAEFGRVGVRVVSGRDIVEFGNQDFGLYRMGDDGRIEHLASPVWNWGRYYELIVRSIRSGRWAQDATTVHAQKLNYWWGMSAGVVDVLLFDDLPQGPRMLATSLRDSVVRGVVDPFAGELVSQAGVERGASESPLHPSQIVGMRWLNENVVGRIPHVGELDATGAREVALGGVAEAAPGAHPAAGARR